MKNKIRIIAVGGHLSPLLSVIEELKSVDKDNFGILVIGRKCALEGDKALSLEYKIITELGIPFKSITTGRLQRRWTRYTFFSLLKLPWGFIQAFSILKSYKPNVILSFGGYVALPVVVVGFFLRIPVVIHEQTLEAGFSNRVAAIFAKKICISWDTSGKFFPKNKTVLTGNPVRKFSIFNSALQNQFSISNESIPLICIVGGSLGSHAINVLVEGCIAKLIGHFRIIHQTGDAQKYKDFDRLQKIRETLGPKIKDRYILTKFINPEEIGSIFHLADLVISRSGINTVTELLYLGKPSILIPLPFSQNQEQLKNAILLEKTGLGKVVEQNTLTPDRFYEIVMAVAGDLDKYKKSEKQAKELIKTDAAKKVVAVLTQEAKYED